MDKQTIARNALAGMAAEDERRIVRKRAADDARRAWHLVQLAAKTADLAERHLTDSGYQVYRPMLRLLVIPPARSVSHAQRKTRHLMAREKMVAFFPGYSFVRFDVEGDPWHDIFKLVGVYGISCANNMPKAMPDEFIAKLKGKEINGAIPGETPVNELPFHVGDQVKITAGAFIGFTGPIDKVDDGGRISLLLTVLGSVRSVETTVDQVGKLPATHPTTG